MKYYPVIFWLFHKPLEGPQFTNQDFMACHVSRFSSHNKWIFEILIYDKIHHYQPHPPEINSKSSCKIHPRMLTCTVTPKIGSLEHHFPFKFGVLFYFSPRAPGRWGRYQWTSLSTFVLAYQVWGLRQDVPGRKLGSMLKINGVFHLLLIGVFLGVKKPTDLNLVLSFTNFLGHRTKWIHHFHHGPICWFIECYMYCCMGLVYKAVRWTQ